MLAYDYVLHRKAPAHAARTPCCNVRTPQGGGGYIGSRLVRALAGAPAAVPLSVAAEEAEGAKRGTDVQIVIPAGQSYKQVIAHDLRYKERTLKDREWPADRGRGPALWLAARAHARRGFACMRHAWHTACPPAPCNAMHGECVATHAPGTEARAAGAARRTPCACA